MAVPLMRSYTTTGAALNTFGLATDDITGLTITQLNRSNVILDEVSNPQSMPTSKAGWGVHTQDVNALPSQ